MGMPLLVQYRFLLLKARAASLPTYLAIYVAIKYRIARPLPPIRLKTQYFLKLRMLSLTAPSVPALLITDNQIDLSSFQFCRPLTATWICHAPHSCRSGTAT